MVLKSYKLIDLYSRIKNYIDSNYISAIINEEDDNITYVGYYDEPERIAIFKDNGNTLLLVKISQDVSAHLSDNNGKIFEVSSIDELNLVKSGIDVILEMKHKTVSQNTPHIETNSVQHIKINENNFVTKEIKPQRTISKFFKRKWAATKVTALFFIHHTVLPGHYDSIMCLGDIYKNQISENHHW